jgi:hypothetical protein
MGSGSLSMFDSSDVHEEVDLQVRGQGVPEKNSSEDSNLQIHMR